MKHSKKYLMVSILLIVNSLSSLAMNGNQNSGDFSRQQGQIGDAHPAPGRGVIGAHSAQGRGVIGAHSAPGGGVSRARPAQGGVGSRARSAQGGGADTSQNLSALDTSRTKHSPAQNVSRSKYSPTSSGAEEEYGSASDSDSSTASSAAGSAPSSPQIDRGGSTSREGITRQESSENGGNLSSRRAKGASPTINRGEPKNDEELGQRGQSPAAAGGGSWLSSSSPSLTRKISSQAKNDPKPLQTSSLPVAGVSQPVTGGAGGGGGDSDSDSEDDKEPRRAALPNLSTGPKLPVAPQAVNAGAGEAAGGGGSKEPELVLEQSKAAGNDQNQKVDSDNVVFGTADVGALKAMSQAIFTRMDAGLASNVVAAGESLIKEPKQGVWISGFIGSSTDTKGQKKKDGFAGGSIGYELFLADRDLLGFALSSVYGKSKLPGQAIKSDNYIFSAYGLKNFDNAFVSVAVFGGLSNNTSCRNTASGQTKGKFKGSMYGASAAAGYNIRSQQHVITPQIALSYFAAVQKGYKEKGAATAQEVKSKRGSVLNAKLAARYSYFVEMEDMSLIPSITLGVSSDLSSSAKNGGGKVVVSGKNLRFINKTRRQTLFFLAPSFDVKTDNLDFKLSYTFEKGSKFIGHIGSAKVALKF